MKICGVCGHEIKDEAVFCPNCGSRCEEPVYVAQDGGVVDGGNAQGDVDYSQNQQNVQPNQQYAQPNQQYAQPNQQYAQSNQQYAQPNQQYAQPKQPYGQPNPQYGFGYGQGYGNGYNQGYAQNYGYNATASKGAPEEPLSVGSWMLTMLVLTIPVANLVMLFVWAFGEGNRGRKNFCRASLIYVAISIVIYIVFIVLMLVVFGASAVSSSTGYY